MNIEGKKAFKGGALADLVRIGALVCAATLAAGAYGRQLQMEVSASHKRLSSLFLNRCDAASLHALLAENVQMKDIRGRMLAEGAGGVLMRYRRACDASAAVGHRHDVLPGTRRVFGFGASQALEVGVHRVYARSPGGRERLIAQQEFSLVWVKSPGGWRLLRSYGVDFGCAHPDSMANQLRLAGFTVAPSPAE